jgi:hypothetical protein
VFSSELVRVYYVLCCQATSLGNVDILESSAERKTFLA